MAKTVSVGRNNDKLRQLVHNTKSVNRTHTMRFHPYVFTGNAPRKGWRGVPAELDEAIPLKTIKYNEQHDEKNTDDRHHSYYAYDHAGGSCGSRAQSQACLSYAEMQQRRRSQRTLKVTGRCDRLDINAWILHTVTSLRDHTVYPSPYVVLSNHGYTKHYYAGAERVAARIGGGNLNHDTECIVDDGEAIERSNNLFWQCSDMVNSAVIEHRDLEEMNIVNIDNDEMEAMWKFDMKQVPSMMKAEVIPEPWKILDAIEYFSHPNSIVSQGDDDEPDVYFYHSDHLGSASWITDATGTPVQHLQYLPYGEPFVNQRVSGYNERFTFTGKERDEETGYSYFGARYMDHELMTMWLSVDPLADKYPSISPYNYCMWNPVKLIDPDGMDNVIYLVNLQGKKQKVDANNIVREANRYFSEMGLSTRVMMAPDGHKFDPAYMDKTDSYVVLGSHADVSAYLSSHMQLGEYREHFSDWAGGTFNPERSSKSIYNKTSAIALDVDGLNNSAKLWGESSSTMGAFLIMHGAGHNATLGHADNINDDNHRSNMGNARIMASGNRIFHSGQSLDYFMGKDNNSVYIRVMQEKFGMNPAVDNYYKNKNSNAINPYTSCPTY